MVRRTGGSMRRGCRAAISGTTSELAKVDDRLPARGDERRGSALHPLHLGLDRTAEGRAAHLGRLSRLRRDDASDTCSTITTATSIGARPMSAGSPGHSYIVYGPLANGATTLMFEGVPNYPDPSRFWQVVDKHKVNIFYTAPTAIRALMGAGDEYVKRSKPEVAQAARQRRRADQSGSVGVVLPRGRRGALPDRRYLVADRDRRHPHHAAARRHQAQARLGDAALFRRPAGGGRHRGQHRSKARRPAISSSSMPGPG